jgi:hypothetical protein
MINSEATRLKIKMSSAKVRKKRQICYKDRAGTSEVIDFASVG